MSDMLAGSVVPGVPARPSEPARHPFDPDQARSSKATAVLVLGVTAVITGPLVGGIVPAILALMLARQAEADLRAGQGYLTGAGQIRRGVMLAWVGIVAATAALVAAAVVGILALASGAGQDFPNTSD